MLLYGGAEAALSSGSNSMNVLLLIKPDISADLVAISDTKSRNRTHSCLNAVDT